MKRTLSLTRLEAQTLIAYALQMKGITVENVILGRIWESWGTANFEPRKEDDPDLTATVNEMLKGVL